MNGYIVNVDPKEFVTVRTAKSVEMRVQNLNIGVSVDVCCMIKDENGNIFQVQTVSLSGEEYDNWGNNDVYLVTTVLSKLDLTPNPNPPPVPN
uniref:Uncharacterized protein n=1 Tax=viral metagenome TaxID=1070528 RepID=A0A6C0I7S2_9ZZZZ